jgi:hypothetical protein
LSELLEPRVLLAAVSWDGGAGTVEWTDALNWSNDLLPGPDDNVTIDLPSGTVHVSSGRQEINSLTANTALTLYAVLSMESASSITGSVALQTGGRLSGAGDVAMNGILFQTGTNNALEGTGQLIINPGSLYEVTPAQVATSVILSRPIIVSAGATMRYAAPRNATTAWRWMGTRVENNGLFEIVPIIHPTDTPWGISYNMDAQSLLVNHGTTRFAPPPDIQWAWSFWHFDGRLENRGLFEVAWGEVRFDDATVANYGTIRTAVSEAKLELGAGDSVHHAGASLEGPGYLALGRPALASTHVFAANTFNPTGVVGVRYGTIELNEPFTGFTLEGGQINRATLVFNTPQTLDSLNLASGSITGTGDVTFAGTTTWPGNGTISGPGRRIVPAGATFNMTLGTGISAEKQLNTTLEVLGTLNRSGGGLAMNNGTIHVKPGGQFNDSINVGSAMPEIRSTGGANAFVNEGTLTKTGTYALTFPALDGGVRFDNSGQVNLMAGQTWIQGGGTNAGAMNVAAPALLTYWTTAYIHAAGSALNGPGAITFGFGNHSVGGVVNNVSMLLVAGFGASATFDGPIALGDGTFEVQGDARATLRADARVGRLLATFGGSIDLTDQTVIVDYSGASPLSDLRVDLTSGYNNGAWNGVGIFSSAAAATPGHAVGYAEATELFGSFPATFNGQSIDNTTVLLRYTRYGDANLDRTVNLDDFNRLAARFGQTGTSWAQGNFNYDGSTNLSDFNLLAANFGRSVTA